VFIVTFLVAFVIFAVFVTQSWLWLPPGSRADGGQYQLRLHPTIVAIL
jgi:hypothetical protein